MAEIKITAGGVGLVVTKNLDGSLTAFTSQFPGQSFDGSGGYGNAGFRLSQADLKSDINNALEQRRFYTSQSVNAQLELGKLERNPSSVISGEITPERIAWFTNDLQSQIKGANQKVQSYQQLLNTQNDLLASLSTITSQFNSANPDNNINSTTNTGQPTPLQSDALMPNSAPKPDTVIQNLQPELITTGPTGAATQAEADAIMAEQQLQIETDLGATQNEADFLIQAQREAAQTEYETQLGATEGEANLLIKAQQEADQLEYETQLGATESEANLLIKAQREADANEFAFGGTQTEADFIINEQKQISDFESSLGAAGATQAEADAINNALASAGGGTNRGLSGQLAETRGEATSQDASNFQQKQDWRVKLSLAPGSTYLYNNRGNEGILLPLAETDGVIFPYTPAISVAYSASYDNTELTHSNYKFFSYRASAVDSISITCDFTAQDTFEANYLLAVIHFFRSVTKMFYGQDQNPKPGTPPPLCYLTGLGAFQFDEHPIAITGFTYSLPTEVDYIRAGVPTTQPGVNKRPATPPTGAGGATEARLQSSGLRPGALAPPVYFTENAGTREPTYVPTKIQMAITAVPIVTRNDISNQFSLEEYATGKLLRGSKRSGGGIW
jgi:hypothetical protein